MDRQCKPVGLKSRSRASRRISERKIIEPLEARCLLAAYSAAEYFPLAPGNHWDYSGTYTDSLTGDGTTDVATDTKTSSLTSFNGAAVSKFTDSIELEAGWHQHASLTRYYSYDPAAGLRMHGQDSGAGQGSYQPALVILTPTVTDGQVIRWSNVPMVATNGSDTYNGTDTGTSTIYGIERISAVGGTLDALKVTINHTERASFEYEGVDVDATIGLVETMWLVRGVGPVRWTGELTLNASGGGETESGTISESFTLTSSNLALTNLSARSLIASPAQIWTGGILGVTRDYAVSTFPVTSNFLITYRLSSDRVWSVNDVPIAQYDVVSYLADKTVGAHRGTNKLTVPAGTKPGYYYVLAKLDNANAVTESNKADNVIVGNTVQVLAEINDCFAYSTRITGASASTSGTNVGATREAAEPIHAGYAGGRSVWWTWTAPDSGLAVIDASGSSFKTLLAVYTGSTVSALNAVAGNRNLGSSVAFAAVKGQTYQIALDGYLGAAGNIKLNVKLTAGVLDEKQAATLGSWRSLSGGYQGAAVYTGPGNGANTATWTFSNLAAGTYRVSATWLNLATAATNAPFKIYDGNKLLGTVLVNQKNGPAGTSFDGAAWQALGAFRISSGSLVIKLSNYANGYVVADGVRIEKIG